MELFNAYLYPIAFFIKIDVREDLSEILYHDWEWKWIYICDKIGKLAQIKSDVFAHSGIK